MLARRPIRSQFKSTAITHRRLWRGIDETGTGFTRPPSTSVTFVLSRREQTWQRNRGAHCAQITEPLVQPHLTACLEFAFATHANGMDSFSMGPRR